MCCIDFQDVFFLTQWTQLKTHGFMATSPSSAPSIRCGTVVITLLERGTALNPRVSSSNLRSMFYYSDTNDRHQPPNPLVPNPAGRWQLCDLRQSEWCLQVDSVFFTNGTGARQRHTGGWAVRNDGHTIQRNHVSCLDLLVCKELP